MSEFSDLQGQVITDVQVTPHEVTFTCADGKKYLMAHEQDCCETVELIDVVGE